MCECLFTMCGSTPFCPPPWQHGVASFAHHYCMWMLKHAGCCWVGGLVGRLGETLRPRAGEVWGWGGPEAEGR